MTDREQPTNMQVLACQLSQISRDVSRIVDSAARAVVHIGTDKERCDRAAAIIESANDVLSGAYDAIRKATRVEQDRQIKPSDLLGFATSNGVEQKDGMYLVECEIAPNEPMWTPTYVVDGSTAAYSFTGSVRIPKEVRRGQILFLYGSKDPQISMLRRFAKAIGVVISKLVR